MLTLAPVVTSQPIPQYIVKAIVEWREFSAAMPMNYIKFHERLAIARLEALRTAYGFEVFKTRLVDSGWLDGMRELEAIIETKSGKLKKLVWCDSNQDFLVRLEHGSGAINDTDLA